MPLPSTALLCSPTGVHACKTDAFSAREAEGGTNGAPTWKAAWARGRLSLSASHPFHRPPWHPRCGSGKAELLPFFSAGCIFCCWQRTRRYRMPGGHAGTATAGGRGWATSPGGLCLRAAAWRRCLTKDGDLATSGQRRLPCARSPTFPACLHASTACCPFASLPILAPLRCACHLEICCRRHSAAAAGMCRLLAWWRADGAGLRFGRADEEGGRRRKDLVAAGRTGGAHAAFNRFFH